MKITFTWISWYKTVFHALCYWGYYRGITWSEAMIFALDDFFVKNPETETTK
jgi:hypothetical protein